MENMRLVGLDVGGVLRDTSALNFEGYRRAFALVQLQPSFDRLSAHKLRGLGKFTLIENGLRALFSVTQSGNDLSNLLEGSDPENEILALVDQYGKELNETELAKMVKAYEAYFSSPEGKNKVHLLPGAADSVGMLLEKSYKLGIVSNASLASLERDISEIGLEKFDYMVTKEQVKQKKPSGEGIRKMMQEMDVPATQTVYVGDTPVDIRAAKDAGCKSAALLSGMGLRQFLEKEGPDFIFEDLLEMSRHMPGVKD